MGKTAIWTIFHFSPTPLNNFEEQGSKLAPSNVIDSKHCIGGEREFKQTF